MLPAITTRLLETSSNYVAARFDFDRAIRAARHQGMTDEDIAHAVGFSLPMIEAVSGRHRP
jgi:hypothetical protein